VSDETRLGVDVSTVFRAPQRIEKRLGRRLFERDRHGYRAGDLALQLAGHAERIESELEAARSQLATRDEHVSGLVRVTTTDTLLSMFQMQFAGPSRKRGGSGRGRS
jgi:DNA-binding transcriptional LysR family regulator